MSATLQTGAAYILRSCLSDHTSCGGFVWPESGPVEAPDWQPIAECGRGLHGFLWGEGDGSLASGAPDAVWKVARIAEWIDLSGKVKFPRADVVFSGSRADAVAEIVRLGASGAVVYGTATAGDGGAATAGYGGTATAGDRGTATAGDRGTATAGDYGTATAGYGGTATAGDYGTATAGYCGTATAGDGGTATAGDYGTATAGDYGAIAIRWHDGTRYRIAIGYAGENGIEPNTAYRVNAGNLVRA